MNELIDGIFDGLLSYGIDPRIIIIIIAAIPIAEARLAIPVALKCGLSPIRAFFYGFLGSSIIVPLLLVALIPLINFLASTKFMGKIGTALLKRVKGKANAVNGKSTSKRFLGTAAFVAIPLPLTGVWTGSAVAGILGLGLFKGSLAVIAGNFFASLIITLITATFSEYIDIIMAVFTLIALITVISMLIRSFRPKKSA